MGRFFGAKVDSQKKLETPHGFRGRFVVRRSTFKKSWNATWFCGKFRRSTHEKKLEIPDCFVGRFLVWRWTHQKQQKTWNATWFSGKVLGVKVDSRKDLKCDMVFWEGYWCEGRLTKKLETPHGLWVTKKLETFFGAKVDSQKNLKCHMVCGKVLWCEDRLTKKTWNATWFSGKVRGAKVDLQQKLERVLFDTYSGCRVFGAFARTAISSAARFLCSKFKCPLKLLHGRPLWDCDQMGKVLYGSRLHPENQCQNCRSTCRHDHCSRMFQSGWAPFFGWIRCLCDQSVRLCWTLWIFWQSEVRRFWQLR